MARVCSIGLLGGFRVEVDGGAIPDPGWRHRRGADLVKLLALAPGHRLHREQLMEALWPDLSGEAAGANLRKAAHFARRTLGSEASIETDGEMIALWPSAEIITDVERFEAAALEAARSGERSALERAVELYAGELLPGDRYAEWSQEPRDRLRRRHLEVLKAAGVWERVLEVDRADEEAHRALMRAHLETGNRHAAMRQFERLREALHDELGVGPDPSSVALYEEVLAMEGHEPPTPAERALSLLAWGLVHWNRRDLEEAERTAEEARALAVDAGLGRELGEASALLGLVAQARGAWRDRFRTEFIESVQRTPELAPFVFDAHLCLAEFSLYGADGHEEMAPFALELLEVAEEAGSMDGRALATLLLGEVERLSGRLDRAEVDLSRAVELHETGGSTSGLTLALEHLAEAALARGLRWRAGRLLQRALPLAETDPLASHLVVRVYGAMVEGADPARSMAILQEAEVAVAVGAREVCEPCSMALRVNAAIASARAGDLGRSARHLEEAERIAGMWQGGPWLAAVWEARGALRLAEGDRAQAAALFREAAELFARVGRPLDEARCRASAAA